jgi:hypothetical protein
MEVITIISFLSLSFTNKKHESNLTRNSNTKTE